MTSTGAPDFPLGANRRNAAGGTSLAAGWLDLPINENYPGTSVPKPNGWLLLDRVALFTGPAETPVPRTDVGGKWMFKPMGNLLWGEGSTLSTISTSYPGTRNFYGRVEPVDKNMVALPTTVFPDLSAEMIEIHIPSYTFTVTYPTNLPPVVTIGKPMQGWLDKNGRFGITLPDEVDYVFVRLKWGGLWRRVPFDQAYTYSATDLAHGTQRPLWVNGFDNALQLRYGDVNNNDSIEQGLYDGNGRDEKYIINRNGGKTIVTDPDSNNAVYRYDYRADLNRDGSVNVADETLFKNTLSRETLEKGDKIQ